MFCTGTWLTLRFISAPEFGSVSLVESVIVDEKVEAERELQKLTHLLEKHNVSYLSTQYKARKVNSHTLYFKLDYTRAHSVPQ